MEFNLSFKTSTEILKVSPNVKVMSGAIQCPAWIRLLKSGTCLYINSLPLEFSYENSRFTWSIDTQACNSLDSFLCQGITGVWRYPVSIGVPLLNRKCLTDMGQDFLKGMKNVSHVNNSFLPTSHVISLIKKIQADLDEINKPSPQAPMASPPFSQDLLKKMEEANAKAVSALKEEVKVVEKKPACCSREELIKLGDAFDKITATLKTAPLFSQDLLKKMEEANAKAVSVLKGEVKVVEKPFQVKTLNFLPDDTTELPNEFVEMCKKNSITFYCGNTEDIKRVFVKSVQPDGFYGLCVGREAFKSITGRDTEKSEETVYAYFSPDSQLMLMNSAGEVFPPSTDIEPYWARFLDLIKEKFKVTCIVSSCLKKVEEDLSQNARKELACKVLELISSNWDRFHSYKSFVSMTEKKCQEFQECITPGSYMADQLSVAIRKARKAVLLMKEHNQQTTGIF